MSAGIRLQEMNDDTLATAALDAAKYAQIFSAHVAASTLQKYWSVEDFSAEDDDPSNEVVVWHFDPQRQGSLPFSVTWDDESVSIYLTDTLVFWFDYLEFSNPKHIAGEIYTYCQMLMSGQLSVLITKRYDIPCASELLLHRTQKNVASIYASTDYPWDWSQADDSGYTADILANSFAIIPKIFPKDSLLFHSSEQTTLRHISEPLKPLTKGLYTYIESERRFTGTGKRHGESEWSFFYKSWELWLCIGLVLIGTWAIGRFVLHTDVLRYAHGIGLVLTALCYAALLPLLRRKERLRAANPRHLWIRLDTWLHDRIYSWPPALLGGISLWLTFTPVLAKKAGDYVSLYYYTPAHQWAYLVPILLAGGCFLAFERRDAIRDFSYGMIAAGNIVFNVVNAVLTNDDVDTPEPYTSILMVTHILSVGLAVYIIGRWARRKARASGVRNSLNEKFRACLTAATAMANLAGGALLIWAACRLPSDLTDDMIEFGNPLAYVTLFAIFTVGYCLTLVWYAMGKLRREIFFRYVVYGMIIIGLAFGFGTTDRVNSMSGLTWNLLLFGIGLPLFFGLWLSIFSNLDRKKFLATQSRET